MIRALETVLVKEIVLVLRVVRLKVHTIIIYLDYREYKIKRVENYIYFKDWHMKKRVKQSKQHVQQRKQHVQQRKLSVKLRTCERR